MCLNHDKNCSENSTAPEWSNAFKATRNRFSEWHNKYVSPA